jgi:endonuclease/exonuclease/phosphatase family metal-dependent hydrolase
MSLVYIPNKIYPTEPNSFAGNAILSSQPFTHVRAVPLANWQSGKQRHEPDFAPRGGLASAIFNGRHITLGVAHLSARWSPAGREQQMAEFMAALPTRGPVLIGGDFNTTTVDLSSRVALLNALGKSILRSRRFRSPETQEPLFKQLDAAGFDFRSLHVPFKPTFTFTTMIPPFMRPKLDWLAVRQLSAVPGSASIVRARPYTFGRQVSDHDFVMCEIDLSDPLDDR